MCEGGGGRKKFVDTVTSDISFDSSALLPAILRVHSCGCEWLVTHWYFYIKINCGKCPRYRFSKIYRLVLAHLIQDLCK